MKKGWEISIYDSGTLHRTAFMIVGNVVFSDKSTPLESQAVNSSQAQAEDVETFSLKKTQIIRQSLVMRNHMRSS